MKFEGTLESVCDYLEITPILSDRIRQLLGMIKVTNIECDSRRVTKGTVFYAKKGAHFNPFEHLEEIKAKGAVAILVDAPSPDIDEDEQDGWQSVLNYAQVGNTIQAKSDDGANSDSSEQKKPLSLSKQIRSGNHVITKYISDPILAQSEYAASQDTEEAKAIAKAKMLRLVLPSNKSLSALAGFIYGNPSEKLRLIGVTGTNGKSTITNLIAQMLNRCGHKCAVFGTLGYGFLDDMQQSANTTLDAISLQRELAHYVSLGADYAVMEVSSIGFCEGRVSGLKFYAGAFSNLSRDHLDYHKNMEDYFESKLNFLKMIPPKHLVVNCNNQEGSNITSSINNCYQVTIQNGTPNASISSQLNVQNIKYESSYTELAINVGAKKTLSTKLNLLGKFNVENFAVALGVLVSIGYDIKFLMRNASKLKPITGRMECFYLPEKPRLIVDYAHTPDGVEQALRAARSHTDANGRIFVVIGCGGDRDSGKRSIMAIKSSVYADYAIFTADNPRSEQLSSIINDMILGVQSGPNEFNRYEVMERYNQISLLLKDYKDLVIQSISELKSKGNMSYQNCNVIIDKAIAHKQSFSTLNSELEICGFESNDAFIFEHTIDYLGEILNLCKASLSFEQYEALRIKYDKTLVNQALKGDYYQNHQEIFGVPTCLVNKKDVDRNVFVIEDRYQAIRFAYEHANKNDCVVIAGKGHEDYQIFADRTIHFSDREICCELLGINEDGTPLTELNSLELEQNQDQKASSSSYASKEPKEQPKSKVKPDDKTKPEDNDESKATSSNPKASASEPAVSSSKPKASEAEAKDSDSGENPEQEHDGILPMGNYEINYESGIGPGAYYEEDKLRVIYNIDVSKSNKNDKSQPLPPSLHGSYKNGKPEKNGEDIELDTGIKRNGAIRPKAAVKPRSKTKITPSKAIAELEDVSNKTNSNAHDFEDAKASSQEQSGSELLKGCVVKSPARALRKKAEPKTDAQPRVKRKKA